MYIYDEVWSADKKAAESPPSTRVKIIADGELAKVQVYNATETGFCYNLLPDKMLNMKIYKSKYKSFIKI